MSDQGDQAKDTQQQDFQNDHEIDQNYNSNPVKSIHSQGQVQQSDHIHDNHNEAAPVLTESFTNIESQPTGEVQAAIVEDPPQASQDHIVENHAAQQQEQIEPQVQPYTSPEIQREDNDNKEQPMPDYNEDYRNEEEDQIPHKHQKAGQEGMQQGNYYEIESIHREELSPQEHQEQQQVTESNDAQNQMENSLVSEEGDSFVSEKENSKASGTLSENQKLASDNNKKSQNEGDTQQHDLLDPQAHKDTNQGILQSRNIFIPQAKHLQNLPSEDNHDVIQSERRTTNVKEIHLESQILNSNLTPALNQTPKREEIIEVMDPPTASQVQQLAEPHHTQGNLLHAQKQKKPDRGYSGIPEPSFKEEKTIPKKTKKHEKVGERDSATCGCLLF